MRSGEGSGTSRQPTGAPSLAIRPGYARKDGQRPSVEDGHRPQAAFEVVLEGAGGEAVDLDGGVHAGLVEDAGQAAVEDAVHEVEGFGRDPGAADARGAQGAPGHEVEADEGPGGAACRAAVQE